MVMVLSVAQSLYVKTSHLSSTLIPVMSLSFASASQSGALFVFVRLLESAHASHHTRAFAQTLVCDCSLSLNMLASFLS
jgi:hypothetical protein